MSDEQPRGAAADSASARRSGLCRLQPVPAQAGSTSAPTSGPTQAMRSTHVLSGQRRQASVLFTDVAGSTRIVEQLGEEESFLLMHSIFSGSIEIIRAHGGTVQDFTGDGLMALFGIPTALEDAPVRCCAAALEIQQWMAEFRRSLDLDEALQPELRIGINSGPVVVGEIGTNERPEFAAVGDTVNVASRLESVADPGTVVISERTRALVGGFFETESIGEHRLKGKRDPLVLYRLIGSVPGVSRFEARTRRGLADFVGRKNELAELSACLEALRQRKIHFADIVGGPGIGKSRIVHELARPHGRDDLRWLRGQCASSGSVAPFQPFAEILRDAFEIASVATSDQVEAGVRSGLAALELESARHLPFLLLLLGLEGQGLPTDIEAEHVGLRLRGALLEVLRAIVERQPTVLAIEDLHWIDRSSEDLLLTLAQSAQPWPLLVVCTYRPPYRPPWHDFQNVRRIELAPLARESTVNLIRNFAGREKVSTKLASLVADKVEGNPLFAEEMVAYVVEESRRHEEARESATLEIAAGVPGAIEGLLMQRIDQMKEHQRTVLQVAAVVGRWFSADVLKESLRSVAEIAAPTRPALARRQHSPPVPAETRYLDDFLSRVEAAARDLADHLEALSAQELIFGEPDQPGPRYRFKHALIQDAVYETIPRGNKELLHSAVAEALERVHQGKVEEISDLLAYHYRRTHNSEKALRYLVLAGKKSLRVYSIGDAQGRFAEALDLVREQPDCDDPTLVADLILHSARISFFNCDIRGAIEILEEFLHVAESCGDQRRISYHLSELAHAYIYAARPKEAEPLLDRAFDLAVAAGDADAKGRAMLGRLWNSVFWVPPTREQRRMVQDLGWDAVETGREAESTWIMVTAMFALAQDAVAHANPREIRRHAQLLKELHEKSEDPRALSLSLVALAELDALNADYERAIEKADAALPLLLTPIDRKNIECVKGLAAGMSERAEEACSIIGNVRAELTGRDLNLACLLIDDAYGVAQFASGKMAKGVRWIEDSMQRREHWGFAMGAANGHSFLGEIYTRIALGEGSLPRSVIFRNLWFLLRTKPFARRIARRHLESAIRDYRAYDAPSYVAWALLDLGLLDKAKGRLEKAKDQLLEARRLADSVEADALTRKIDDALRDLNFCATPKNLAEEGTGPSAN